MEPAGKLIEFCRVLRGLGVRVSAPDIIDAASALLYIDWSNRELFKLALQAVLVKNAADIHAFHSAFEHYFVDWETQQHRQQETCRSRELRQQEVEEGTEDLTFQGKPLNIPDELKQLYTKIPEKEKLRLRSFLEKTSHGNLVQNNFQPIVERMVVGSLEYWRRQLQEEELTYHYQNSGDEYLDEIIKAAAGNLTKVEKALLYKDLSHITDDEITTMSKLIKKMARSLATQISRRYRRSNKTQRIDFRKSLRTNLMYGGILLKPKFKSKLKTKPNLVILCDVSGSMAKYAAFVLQFVYGLSHLTYRIESFIFAENVERMTPHVSAKKLFAEIMSEIMMISNQWGKGTNLRKSLLSIESDYPKTLQPSTILVIVSDTLTLHSQAAVEQVQRISRKIKDVIWLNTLPQKEWHRYQTVDLFQKVTRMMPCNTLAELENIVRKQLFRR